jgi:recombination protein RecR
LEKPVRSYPRALEKLIEELEKLPGVGPKTAQRLAFHILGRSKEDGEALAEAIVQVKERIRSCQQCFNYSEEDLCELCRDARRDASQICVVAEARDLHALERSGDFRGLYHVLGGLLSPIEGVGPDNLHIRELLARLHSGEVKEVILATNPTVEGDATAAYLAGLMKPVGVRVSRIALGLPVGGDLDYADEVTVARALSGRTEM